MDRNTIRATVRKGIDAYNRLFDSRILVSDYANLVECVVDAFITEEEEALQRVIELYPEAEPLLRDLSSKRGWAKGHYDAGPR